MRILPAFGINLRDLVLGVISEPEEFVALEPGGILGFGNERTSHIDHLPDIFSVGRLVSAAILPIAASRNPVS